MIYRNKIVLQNTKPLLKLSPIYQPKAKKKTSANLSTNIKASPKNISRQGKQNREEKSIKTQRINDEKYFKIPKQSQIPESKASKPRKPLITIVIDQNLNEQIINYKQVITPNLQTPKFKCSDNKIQGFIHKKNGQNNENYFSFGDDFRKSLTAKPQDENIDKEKVKKNNYVDKFKPLPTEQKSNQKFSINSFKKKQKNDRTKQNEQQIKRRFLQMQKSIRENKGKNQQEYFCFKK